MQKFLTHEAIAGGYFNQDFNVGVGVFSAWAGELANSGRTVDFLIQRLQTDYERLNPKMRKAFGAKDVALRSN